MAASHRVIERNLGCLGLKNSMAMKPVTVWAVYQKKLCIWIDGDLVAEIPASQWHRLIRDLADQFWTNEAEVKESYNAQVKNPRNDGILDTGSNQNSKK